MTFEAAMSRFRLLPLWAAVGLAAQLLARVAAAHIHLLEPEPRYPDAVAGENKNCPCWVGTAGRTCGKPEERSDPNRSADRATAVLGGSLLTVRLSEYVGHSGRFRVAFDPEGADVADFNQHILADIADPEGKLGNTGNGSLWEISARLPNIDCNNCTLQVVQVMNGDTVDPVADTVGQSTYYQCADLELTHDPSLPEGYAPPFIGPPLLPEDAPDPTDAVKALFPDGFDFQTEGFRSGGAQIGILHTEAAQVAEAIGKAHRLLISCATKILTSSLQR